MNKSSKKFLKTPEYPGGKKALSNFIKTNLKYPKEAVEKKIQGIVYCTAEIDDTGKVIQVKITKGLPGGCNEEAVRLIKCLKFGSVKNRGIRLKTKRKFRIRFQLPNTTEIKYSLKNKTDKKDKETTPRIYNYTIITQ